MGKYALKIFNIKGFSIMKISTSNGKEIIIPDMCSHCSLNTGGQHETHCPLAGYEGQIGNTYFSTPVYTPCPDASWTLWCPCVGTKECEECPIRKEQFNQILKKTVEQNRDILDALRDYDER